ncbi:spermidine synthase [Acidipropionibacterium acidipropionici]|uniref:spermidine synthase n=1 Tax=Acidipropionibacterium acidipropionici TaxID=1748 RepID=UPI00041EE83F|nr:fused MFS/spermidine synthase [Acidipropionibacterium acidipropionici]
MADRGRREAPDPGEEHLVPDPQRPGAWLVRIGGADQSWVDPAHPTLLEFDYMERIADHLDLHRPAGERMRVVHIGGAGMNLARYVSATRPTSPQIVLEPDAGLTEEVRRKAPLPPRSGIKVRPLDGRAGIAAMREDFADVVILDAFAGARVPGELVTAECFADISRVLVPDGILVANVADSAPMTLTRGAVAGLREVFGQVVLEAESATLKGRRYGNVILAASHAPLPVDEVTRRCAGAPFPFRVVHGPALERMAGGATPFTDEAPEPSPGPPGGASYFA